jgi:4-amino-4-deoxy-L-arabinose transferase-like glycosyltransferase
MLLLAFALGLGLRFYRFGELPPGFYQDEGFNGLDALSVIHGAHPIYFPANNGREPLYLYLAAFSIAVFGRSPAAERLPAAIVGALLVPAAYGLGRALFNRRLGLFTAFIAAGNLWALTLSRIGLRAGLLPLLMSLSLTCAVVGWRSRRLWLVAVGGGFYGLNFYTYLAARFTPLALIAFLILWYIAHRPTFPAARWLVAFILPAALVVAPLAVFAISQPQIAFGRAEQVSIFSPALNGGDPWGMLFHNLIATLGMFIWRGDANVRHNLPGRPVFDVFLGAAFVVGVMLSLRQMLGREHRRPAALVFVWSSFLLAPTVLTIDAPHYLRAVGVLPMIYIFPALALEAVWTADFWRGYRTVGRWLVVALIAASSLLTIRDYFSRYANDPETHYFFQSAVAELAAQANSYLGSGWTGGLTVSAEPIDPQRRLYLDHRLWDSFASLRFLIPESSTLRVFSVGDIPNDAPAVETRVIVWPYDDPQAALKLLPEGELIEAQAGPLYRGDREAEPYSLYSVYTASPAPRGRPLAEFERGIALQSAHVARMGNRLRVELIWAAQPNAWQPDAEADHVFVQLFEGEALIAQQDGQPAAALYPTTWWRAGDFVADAYWLPLPTDTPTTGLTLNVGLYRYPALERLSLKNGSGDFVEMVVE